MKTRFLDKLIDRLDKLDPGSLQTHFLHLVGEKGLLETIFHAIQEGVIVLDESGTISYANRAAEGLLGFNLESAAGTSISRYLKEIDWDLILQLDEDEWSRLVSREIETTYPEHRFLSFYLVPLSATDAAKTGAVVILRDITRDREEAVHTRESDRLNAIHLLAAGVAHEIGNPLNSLNIHLQLIRREAESLSQEAKEGLSELVDVACGEVSRLDQIITQFLGAVRPQPVQLEPSDLGELTNEALRFMRNEIEDRGILLEAEISESLPKVSVDRSQIKQAFYNLMKNAVQAMEHGGVLKINVTETDRFVAVTFRDSGKGISADDLGGIFEPYRTTKAEGSGLGLMIVQRIMRDHSGEIEIDSEPNKGTAVTLYFTRDEMRIRLLESKAVSSESERTDNE